MEEEGSGDPGTLLGLCNVECTGCVSFLLLLFCFVLFSPVRHTDSLKSVAEAKGPALKRKKKRNI